MSAAFGSVLCCGVKDIDPSQTSEMIDKIADNYLFYAGWYQVD